MSKQAKVDVILNTEQAKSALKEVQSELKQVKTLRDRAFEEGDIKGYNQLNTQYKKLTSEAGKLEKQSREVSDVMKNLSSTSIRELETALRRANSEFKLMKQNDPGFAKKADDVKKLRSAIDGAYGRAKEHSSGMEKLALNFNKYFAVATTAVAALTGVMLSLQRTLKGNIELSDSLTDVAKTTGLSISEVKELNNELRKIDTRTSRKELLDLAYAAGKLGYSGQAEVLGFVKAADKIGVALSKDLGGNVEEAVTSLGKLVDIFKIKDEFGIEEALIKTGSAINSLGASGTANEAYIVDFTKRLGGIAPQAGISIEQVMGLAATLDQLGQQTETSATAITQLLTKMFADPATYAKIAGQSVQDFNLLLQTDANKALIQLLEGLNKNKGGLSELAVKFGDLGVDGSRAISVIGALSNNVKMLTDTQDLSNTEFDKGNSLLKEFNLKNDNLAGNAAKVGRALLSAFVNSSVMGGMEKMVAWMAKMVEIPVSKTMEEDRIKVNALAMKLGEANTALSDRKKIIDELRVMAPSIVQGINAESVAYDTLRLNLASYNKEAINRIIIQKNQEKIDEVNTKVAGSVMTKMQAEQKIRENLRLLAEDVAAQNVTWGAKLLQINTDEKLSLEAKTQAMIKYVNIAKSTGAIEEPGRSMEKLVFWRGQYNRSLKEETKFQNEVNTLLVEADGYMKALGISTNTKNSGIEKTNTLIDYQKLTIEELNKLTAKGDEQALAEIERRKSGTLDLSNVLTDAFKVLSEEINSLDRDINNAIAAGNTPLAEKFMLEKKAAEALLETYTLLKKGLMEGKDMDLLLFVGPENKKPGTAAKGAGIVKSLTEIKNPLKERDQPDFYGPSENDIAKEKQLKDDLNAQIKDASFNTATSLNNAIFDVVKNRQQAEFDNKMSLLDKERERELSNKNLTEAQKNAINERYAKKEAALRTAAFKKDQNASAVQALINGALGITKTFAVMGFTPPAWVAAAALAANTLIEIAVIKSAKPPEYSAGGYTDKDINDQTPAGIVHANEFIGSAPAVRNPSVKKIFDIIDYAQKNGTISQINLPAVVASTTFNGHKNGGYVSDSTSQTIMPAPANNQITSGIDIPALLEFNSLLKMAVTEGLNTKLSLFDLEKKQAQKSNIQSATEM